MKVGAIFSKAQHFSFKQDTYIYTYIWLLLINIPEENHYDMTSPTTNKQQQQEQTFLFFVNIIPYNNNNSVVNDLYSFVK